VVDAVPAAHPAADIHDAASCGSASDTKEAFLRGKERVSF
jgi:hypothetical protein